jgi:hypothetical protein
VSLCLHTRLWKILQNFKNKLVVFWFYFFYYIYHTDYYLVDFIHIYNCSVLNGCSRAEKCSLGPANTHNIFCLTIECKAAEVLMMTIVYYSICYFYFIVQDMRTHIRDDYLR